MVYYFKYIPYGSYSDYWLNQSIKKKKNVQVQDQISPCNF